MEDWESMLAKKRAAEEAQRRAAEPAIPRPPSEEQKRAEKRRSDNARLKSIRESHPILEVLDIPHELSTIAQNIWKVGAVEDFYYDDASVGLSSRFTELAGYSVTFHYPVLSKEYETSMVAEASPTDADATMNVKRRGEAGNVVIDGSTVLRVCLDMSTGSSLPGSWKENILFQSRELKTIIVDGKELVEDPKRHDGERLFFEREVSFEERRSAGGARFVTRTQEELKEEVLYHLALDCERRTKENRMPLQLAERSARQIKEFEAQQTRAEKPSDNPIVNLWRKMRIQD